MFCHQIRYIRLKSCQLRREYLVVLLPISSFMRNPYLASSNVAPKPGIYLNSAALCGSSFLFRSIQIERPFRHRLVYSGWWFLQKITINGQCVWSAISWLALKRTIAFPVPGQGSHDNAEGFIEIDFAPGLRIQRFRVWVDGEVVFDEVN